MKKIILILLAVVIVIVSIIGIKYYSYLLEKNNIATENAEYEKYKDQETYGIDLATLINKTVDKNEKNGIPKDDQGMYIQNEENSIEIEIYIEDNETTYKMEAFYNTGIEQFVQYYGDIKFKCSNIEYHENTGKIKYMLFEQLPTS